MRRRLGLHGTSKTYHRTVAVRIPVDVLVHYTTHGVYATIRSLGIGTRGFDLAHQAIKAAMSAAVPIIKGKYDHVAGR